MSNPPKVEMSPLIKKSDSPKDDIETVLSFWFGRGSQVFPADEYEWRGQLWWHGVSPLNPEHKREKPTAEQHQAQTDAYIRATFGHLLEEIAGNDLVIKDTSLELWEESTSGQIALVVVLDQFSRNAFRGSSRMFDFDLEAQRLALGICQRADQVPWPHAMFASVALLHSENPKVCELGISSLIQLQAAPTTSKIAARNLSRTIKSGKEHLLVLKKFGRYPHRNLLLGRTSTDAELQYLDSGSLPVWAKSVVSKVNKEYAQVVGGEKGPLRVLILPSSRQNPDKFERKIRKQLLAVFGPNTELVLARPPHIYAATGATAEELNGVEQSDPNSRAWFNATDDPNTMQYVGLETSIASVNEQFQREGPFDGILGFSQGACMVGILSSLRQRNCATVSHVNVAWAIMISGFYCRDSSPRFSGLHLQESPLKHSEGNVTPNQSSVDVWPTLHVWGTSDTLVANWRSEILSRCFHNARILTHPGGHFANGVAFWPVDQMHNWTRMVVTGARLWKADSSGPPISVEPDFDSCQNLRDRLSLTRRINGARIGASNIEQLLFLVPKGLADESDTLQSSIWATIQSKGARAVALDPAGSGLSREETSKWVKTLVSKRGQSGIDDALCLSWCVYPVDFKQRKKIKKGKLSIYSNSICNLSYWIWLSVYEASPRAFLESGMLESIVPVWGCWEDLCRLDEMAVRGQIGASSQEPSPIPGAEDLHENIAQIYAAQVFHDLQAVAGDIGDGEKAGQMPSSCAEQAPRAGSGVDKRTHLGRLTADKLAVMRGMPLYDTQNEYRKALRAILAVRLCDSGQVDERKLMLSEQKKEWMEKVIFRARDEVAYQGLLELPYHQWVVEPEPEPVDISTQEQLAPLYQFLHHSTSATRHSMPEELVFPKGTLCSDGRLDLCKQVIGPQGVAPLISSLNYDGSNQKLVNHLLLGNNVAGDGLGPAVADAVRSRSTAVTTWYIAGNKLTASGIEPIAHALHNDTTVKQLWLKRNPLKADGAKHIARMLSKNSTLAVLDVTNCAIGDEGFEEIVAALASNPSSGLRYLYASANMITVRGIEAVASKLEAGSLKLISLDIACNRVGNAGTERLCQALQSPACSTLKRLDLSSCCLGSSAASAIGQMLLVNKGLQYLDLGCVKMTGPLQEIPNRIGTQGAEALAESLKENQTLRMLGLVNNQIHQRGIDAIKLMMRQNEHLVKITLAQLGVPFSELDREEIRELCLENAQKLDAQRNAEVMEILRPQHLEEVLSVYRVGDTYVTDDS